MWRIVFLLVCVLGLGRPAAGLEIVILTGPEGAHGAIQYSDIGARIAEVIRPVVERHRFDRHQIRIERTSGSEETLARCGRETQRFCLGIVKYGAVDVTDLPPERRPKILRSDLDRACPVFLTLPDRFSSWYAIRERAAEVTFVVPRDSDEEAFVRTLFRIDPALAGIEPRLVRVDSRWPSEILGRIARHSDWVGVSYALPDPEGGFPAHAVGTGFSVLGLHSGALETEVGFEREMRMPVHTVGDSPEPATVSTLCAPMTLVATDPAQLTPALHSPAETEWLRRDLADMIEAIDWELATSLQVEEPFETEVVTRSSGASVCDQLRRLGVIGAEGMLAVRTTASVLRQLGIRAVLHSSGQWIVTSGGAYVAGTIGGLGTLVAVITGPTVITAGSVITAVHYGIEKRCKT